MILRTESGCSTKRYVAYGMDNFNPVEFTMNSRQAAAYLRCTLRTLYNYMSDVNNTKGGKVLKRNIDFIATLGKDKYLFSKKQLDLFLLDEGNC